MAYENNREELEAFKAVDINTLVDRLGYKIDETAKNRGKSGTNWTDGTHQIVTFRGSQVWMFKSYDQSGPNGKTCGTVVDVALDLAGGNMGVMRKTLRDLIGSTKPEEDAKPASTTAPDIPTEVAADYATGTVWRHGNQVHPYLVERGLSDLPANFDGSFSTDRGRHGNAMFRYDRVQGNHLVAAGIERKGRDFKGYTSGGKAGVWTTTPVAGAPWIVCESPIDCMSYAILKPSETPRNYAAVRSGGEGDLIEMLLVLGTGAPIMMVILAIDNDAAGAAYASRIMSGLAKAKTIRTAMDLAPGIASDWNEALMARIAKSALPEHAAPALTPSM